MILSLKKKLVGFKNVSELDWGYAQFQSYINIEFYYQYFSLKES